MTSFRYRMIRFILKVLPFKKMLSAPADKLIKAARRMNAGKGRVFRIPADPTYVYEDISVRAAGKMWHCLVIRDKDDAMSKPDKAVLFLYGGGMISEPDKSDILPAMNLARATGREVWFPFYPLCIDYSAMRSLEMVSACYREMLLRLSPQKVTVLGYSSGANLALALSHSIRERDEKLPQPEKLILISPGAITDDKDWRERAARLASRDILVGTQFFDNVKTIMEHGENLPAWFLNPWSASFDGFPPCHFWFGGDELLAASAPNFSAVCDRAKIPYTMTVEEKMCHSYPFIPGPAFPEKKAAFHEIVDRINAIEQR